MKSQNYESTFSESKGEFAQYVKRASKTRASITLILSELKALDLLEESFVEPVMYLLQNLRTIVLDTELSNEICQLYLGRVLITWSGNICRLYIRLNDQKTLSLRSVLTTNYVEYTVVERSFQNIQEAENLRKNCLNSLQNIKLSLNTIKING